MTRTPQSAEFETWLKEIARADGPPVHLPDLIDIGDLLVDGRFEVTDLLGRGGMGSVYRAWDRQDERAVALKTLRGRRPERLYRLKREFRVLADVRHRNLAKLWELHRDGERWFFTMELLTGVNVVDYLRGQSDQRIGDVIGQLAAGLAALHSAGLAHRDVKPSNTIVDGSGRLVLLDFGLVADLATVSAGRRTVLGTAAYMSPEQAAGDEPTASADLYSVGVILYEVLTGELPAAGCSFERIGDPVLRELAVELLGVARPTAADVARRLDVAVEPASAGLTELVGRGAELATLAGHLDAVDSRGESIVIELRGAPGHGKSALLERFSAMARRRGSVVLAGRCREREQVPFNALDSIIDGVVEMLRDGDSWKLPDPTDALARLFPALVAVCGGGASSLSEAMLDAPSEAPSIDRHQAFTRLANLLAVVAGDKPLCLAIDDAQWADADSVALLSSLVSSNELALLVVLVVGDHRDSLPGSVILDVDALAPAEALSLASALLAGQDGGDRGDRARAIADESQGVPLFIAELSRSKESRDLADLDDVLSRRLAGLDPVAASALEMIASATTLLTREMVLRGLETDRQRVVEAIEGLERGRLVRAYRRRGETALEPYHQRVRDAVGASLSASELRRVHLRIATAIAAERPDDASGLTYHWRHAGELESARACALAAAEAAHAGLAFDRAAELIATALELGVPPSPRLLILRAEALEGAGRGAQAADAYHAAAALLAGDPQERGRVRELERRAAEQLLRAGRIDEGVDAISSLLAAEGMALPRSPIAALAQLGLERLRLRFVRSKESGGDLRRLEATWALAVGLSQVDPIRSALYQARHLRLAVASGDPTRIALGLCADAMSSAARGPPATSARGLLAEAARVGSKSDDPRVPAYLVLADAQVSFLCGEFSAARELAHDAEQLFACCAGARWEHATAKLFYLTCLWHTGHLTTLCREAGDAASEARALDDRYGLVQLQTTVLPPMHLLADQPERAAADLDEAFAAWSRREMFLQHWQHLQASALLYLYLGQPELAFEAFTSRFVGIGKLILSQVKAVRVFTAYVRGISAAGALAQRPSDRDLDRAVRRDIKLLRREGETARTGALIEAQLHHVHGDRDRAIASLRAGITAASERDLQLLAACGRRCLGALTGETEARQLADAYFSLHPIARPDRITSMLMPAFGQ